MTGQERETVGRVEHVEVRRVAAESRNIRTPQSEEASKGLVQMFGLDPRAAVLVTLVDLMIFGADVFSVGTFVVMGVVIATILGTIVYKIQRLWFGDDHDSALIKALIVGMLTAIPVPLTPLLAVPCGIVGAVQMLRHR